MRFWIATGDFETRSRLDLPKVGAWRYSVDPSTEPLCFHYALDDGRVRRWRPGDSKPERLLSALREGAFLEAHNSFFEWCIWHNIMVKRFDWPALRTHGVICSAAKAAVACYPRALEHAAFHAGCTHLKGDDGPMKKLSKPRKPTKNDPREWIDDPELFEKLYEYCDDDVMSERDLSNRVPALSKRERRVFLADMNINLRGLRIDVDFVHAGIKVNSLIDREIASELCGMTRGSIMAATQRDRILKWLHDDGLCIPNLTAETVEDTLYDDPQLTPKQRRMLVLRQEGCRSSVSKYRALDQWRDGDIVRGLYIYYGANAHGRFSAKGPQPQNFPRGDAKCLDPEVKGGDAMKAMVAAIKRTAKDGKLSRLREQFRIEESEVFGDPRSPRHMIAAPPAEVLSTAIRGVFIARPDKTFGVGDYSAIEARKVFWFAGEKRGLKILADGGDIYRDQASDIFNKAPEDLDVGFERMMGKTVILGCGYGMGWKKFKLTCKRSYGMVIDDELCKKSVYSYRDRYTAVPEFWKVLDKTARRCIRTGRSIEVSDGKLEFRMDDSDLKIRLPSARDIIFRNARISHDQIVFTNGKGYSETTYGGKICEYVCSGSARDVLADAIVMAEFDYDDVDPVMHSHDELVCEGEPDKVGKIVAKIMKVAVDNYEGLPMKIESWESPVYHK
jgi:DNA polymerase